MSASAEQVAQLLRACDAGFVPPLSARVDIDAYAAKLAAQATLVEAWDGDVLAGLVAIYCNNHDTGIAYVSNVSVAPAHTRRGIAGRLLREALARARAAGMRGAALAVHGANAAALALYRQHGFTPAGESGPDLHMELAFTSEHPQ
ncbi:GNAT family N-acetyltransferase [Massilia sp. CFBP9012]|uniref:GNAT family N-acetyltransferase n=1 Tax=Massilia sp. CFBP9012 TaxID=3096531 RepID=UPI002A6A8DF0|nr:GNAT family N-acetyltransferase [Massilia sp. CFBP9012]MDY0974750.1 GNAT family N-acetyltransferase [Massilia sp. CFBP9012]